MLVAVVFTTLVLLRIFILRRKQRSKRSIGQVGHSTILSPREKKPVTIAEEELGLEGKPQGSFDPQSHQDSTTSPSAAANDDDDDEEYTLIGRLEAPLFFNSMANKDKPPSPPSVLRPTARPPTPHSGSSATIALAQGRYTGVLLPASSTLPRDVEAWRGIPYAQSTGGENRFRPPVPLLPNAAAAGLTREVNASAFGQICPGSIARVEGITEGEDCLNLNVYRQRQDEDGSGRKMPVLVYVHGGAFNGGMGVERDMASFVGWAETPIVGINFNYRVGALGFPSSVVADGEGCLNLGLRDQRLLFEWVRENVGAFGGDKNKVTVMGLSAGAHSIGYHLQSPSSLANAPFHAAILESGGSTARATLAPTHPRTATQWREFLLAASINPDTTPTSRILPLLRSLPLETILNASNVVFSRYQDPIRWPFQPTIENPTHTTDGIITALPITRFRAGEFLRIPILTGFNTHEGSVFCNPATHTTAAFLSKFTTMLPALTTADLTRLASLYPDPATDDSSPYTAVPPGYGTQWARYEAAYAHYAYICPVVQTAHFYSESFYRHYCAQTTTPPPPSSSPPPVAPADEEAPPVWVYHFAALSRRELGGKANHGDEAVVVAHDMGAIGRYPGLVRTSAAMHGAWVRFVANGDPNAHLASSSSSSSSNKEEEEAAAAAAAAVYWPRFRSPFIGDTDAAPRQLRRKQPSGGAWGRVMMFGEGNDERCGEGGAKTPGTPARVVSLSEHEEEQCKYWWGRVELSQGMGRRLGNGKARL
ncbi:hypothetical protein N0V82_000816 [Gnomoniopsis sp. IMI 355080]|nr:hypothetical protein N0V82_000816 [Gnomoniopsis sp. IMI 355080]